MTAEIVILNKSAAALAADSIVTIQHGKNKKTYYTSSKLFPLSDYHPVGIMVYGKADITGVPIETIIKDYSRKLKKQKYDHLEDYVKDFKNYITGNKKIFPTGIQNKCLEDGISALINGVKEQLNKKVEEIAKKAGKPSEKDVKRFTHEVIKFNLTNIRKLKLLPYLKERDIQKFLESCRSTIKKLHDKLLEKIPVTDELYANIEEICVAPFVRQFFPVGFSTGIVFAGFGEQEIFPSYFAIDIECMIFNILKYMDKAKDSISHSNFASVRPFAHTDEVAAFMNGTHPQHHRYLNKLLDKLLVEVYPNTITDEIASTLDIDSENVKKQLVKKFEQTNKDMLKTLREKVHDFEHRRFWGQIIQIVKVLPFNELATMAETLVNLTSFKQRITSDIESVGGPINVAVISKGDGFVWIKRSKYYDSDLNPRLC